MFNYLLQLIDSIVWPLVSVVLIWLAFFLNLNYDLGLNQFGLQPHSLEGLIGIFSMPFLHADAEHLMGNSLPLILSMGFIFLYFEKDKWHIVAIIALATGILLWIIGQSNTNHIGASGLVYGFISFLITHALITKNKEAMAAALVLIFLYGGLFYGLFPEWGKMIGKNISWEGHLAGAISGLITAFFYRHKGPQRAIYFQDEDDDDESDEGYPYWKEEEPQQPRIVIRYNFKEKDGQDTID